MTRAYWLMIPLLALVACGGGDDPETDEDPNDTDTVDTDIADTDTTEVVTESIVATDGGTVSAGGGSLDIPANSLGADTDIGLTVNSDTSGLPDASTIAGDVYNFGPDGTTFDPPAMLTLPLVGAPGTDERAVISWLDGSAWTDLPTTEGSGTVSAEVDHFTVFVVRFIQGAATCEPFTPCGGDPTGNWNLVSICADSNHTAFNQCPESTITADLTGSSGYYTLNGDNTWSALLQISGTISYSLSAQCLDDLIPGPFTPACGALDLAPNITCTGDKTVQCDCTVAISPAQTETTGQWQVNGTTLETHEDGDPPSDIEMSEFCIEGNTLYSISDDGIISVLER